jgi:hypothetical protein
VTRPLRDHREQQNAQFAVIEQPPAMSAAAMMTVVAIVMIAMSVMARVLIAVAVVAVATKSVSKSHMHFQSLFEFHAHDIGQDISEIKIYLDCIAFSNMPLNLLVKI